MAGFASSVRSGCGTRRSVRDFAAAVRACSLSCRSARTHRAVFPAVERALLWRGDAAGSVVAASAMPRAATTRKAVHLMTGVLDFEAPWALFLLPLAILPLLRRRRDSVTFPWLAWLPADR